jgi:hypothetical protein
LLEPGEHELRAHRAVAEQRPFLDRVEERLLQCDSFLTALARTIAPNGISVFARPQRYMIADNVGRSSRW